MICYNHNLFNNRGKANSMFNFHLNYFTLVSIATACYVFCHQNMLFKSDFAVGNLFSFLLGWSDQCLGWSDLIFLNNYQELHFHNLP